MPTTPLPEGIFAAALTPQLDDGSADHDRLASHCRWLLANGCDGVAPLGSTGEANSFSVRERLEIVERLAASGLPFEKVLVGTGCTAVPDSVELTRQAVELGAGGVLMLPPYYYKGVDDDGIFAAFDAVIQSVADPRLKIYLYHFPRMAGVSFSNELVARLVSTYPETVVGMKDSSGDWEHMKSIIQDFPGFKLYTGNEVYLLDVLRLGGAGCISATTNVNCALAARVFGSFEDDPGRANVAQEQLTAVRIAFQCCPFVPGLKRYLAETLDDPGWLRQRPPFSAISDADFEGLARGLEKLGFRPELAR